METLGAITFSIELAPRGFRVLLHGFKHFFTTLFRPHYFVPSGSATRGSAETGCHTAARSDAEARSGGGGSGPSFLPSFLLPFLTSFPPGSGDAPGRGAPPCSRPQPDGITAARPSPWARKGEAGGILVPCASLQLALAMARDFWSSHEEVWGLYT